MIEPQELRIGNWVETGYGPEQIIKIINGDALLAQTENSNIGIKDKSVKGIPLTPEWLERFGFTNKHGKGRFTIGKLKEPFYEYDLDLFKSGKGEICYRNYLTPIKHVHQLQNLYYALTGKELNYDPT